MVLTDEDKAWIAEQLRRRIDGIRTDLAERIDALRTNFTERIDGVRTDFAEHIGALRSDLAERIEKTKTTLLTEFHKWASPVEMRQRSHSAAMRAFDAELEAVSDRMTRLEKPKPPAA
jgi:DNA anti-recombination protein RmuC